MINYRFTYPNDKQITAQIADTVNNFLWTAFAQNSSGNCILEKQHPFTPTQTFHSVSKAVNKIVELDLNSSNIYAIYNDTTSFAQRFALNNPNTSNTEVGFPSGVIESPISIYADNSDVFILTPGSISGQNAKVLRYTTSMSFVEEIDLTKLGLTVTDAVSITVDQNGDIRIATNIDPATIIRVFELSGGGWDFSEYIIE